MQLLVTGKVANIGKDFTHGIVIRLEGVSFHDVHANMEKSEKEQAAKLDKGQTVSVLCTGGGKVVLSAWLRHCTFQ